MTYCMKVTLTKQAERYYNPIHNNHLLNTKVSVDFNIENVYWFCFLKREGLALLAIWYHGIWYTDFSSLLELMKDTTVYFPLLIFSGSTVCSLLCLDCQLNISRSRSFSICHIISPGIKWFGFLWVWEAQPLKKAFNVLIKLFKLNAIQ